MRLREDLKRFPISKLDFGPDGKLVDAEGRTVCTINIKHGGLRLAEAMTYAQLFIAAAENPEAVARALEGGE